MDSTIITLSIGKPRDFHWKGKKESSGIDKLIINEAKLTFNGFVGDDVANHKFHGGPERAVCLYPYEHYSFWEKEFNKKLKPPAFGENICAAGMLEENVYIGDVFSIGDAIIQVTQGRVPCSTISKYNNIDAILGKIVETGFTGYFFKVLKEGIIKSNSKLLLMERKQEEITVLFANQILFHDSKNSEAIKKILQINDLSSEWRERLNKALRNF